MIKELTPERCRESYMGNVVRVGGYVVRYVECVADEAVELPAAKRIGDVEVSAAWRGDEVYMVVGWECCGKHHYMGLFVEPA